MNRGVEASVGTAPRAEAPPAISPWCNSAGKRTFDLIVTAVALVPALPLMLVGALAVKLGSRGPVLFRQKRCGRGGRQFEVLKFRTMQHGASGFGVTRQGDRRITRAGALLRQWKLDELPQLLNVIRGDMSLVGPRPEDPRYVALYTPLQRVVLRARPGITSPASLQYRDEAALLTRADWETTYRETIMPQKIAIELEYLARRTLWTDLGLILRTLSCVVETLLGRAR